MANNQQRWLASALLTFRSALFNVVVVVASKCFRCCCNPVKAPARPHCFCCCCRCALFVVSFQFAEKRLKVPIHLISLGFSGRHAFNVSNTHAHVVRLACLFKTTTTTAATTITSVWLLYVWSKSFVGRSGNCSA